MKSKDFFESIMDDSLNLVENVARSEEMETEPGKNPKARRELELYFERKRLRKLLTFFH